MRRHSIRRSDPGGRGERGFSLMELMVVSVLVLVLAYLVITLGRSGVDAQDYSVRMNRVIEVAQEVTETIRDEVQSSVRLLGNDAIGNAYVGLLDHSGMPAEIDTNRLPALDAGGVFEPDGALDNRTGNSLCFARHAWSDEFRTTSGDLHRIDVYRIVHFYLAAVDGGPAAGSPAGLDLVHWVSEPLADGTQIDRIADALERDEVCEHLRLGTADAFGNTHATVEVVWRVGDDPALASTLRQITSGGALQDAPSSPRPSGSWRILPDAERSRSGILHGRHHSIATNFAPQICGVASFGYESTAGQGFPHGFEIQVIGPSAARQVLVHLSLVSTRPGRLAYHDSQVVADARDL